MNIIGINAYHADASAALIVDGELIVAIEEERFTRKKHWAGFPAQAIQFCLKEANLTFDDIDAFAIGRDPKAKFLKKIAYLARNPKGSLAVVRNRLDNSRQVSSIADELANISGQPSADFKNKVRHVEHHRSHLASAFFASPFDEAACLSIDGSGDFTTTMTAVGKGNTLEVLDSVDFPHSIGIFYSAFTQLLGFPHYGDEYKVMGMAPYGKPVYVDKVSKLISLKDDGLFRLDLDYFRKGTEGIISYGEDFIPQVAILFSEKMEHDFGPERKKDEPLTQYHKDLASSVQRVTEDTIFHILTHLHTQTGLENVCIAGGVAQNSVANGKILQRTPFKQVYIPSAGHDAGISMGSAMYTYFQGKNDLGRKPVFRACTGSRFTNDEIKDYLQNEKIPFRELVEDQLYDEVSNRLINGGVIGWFNGRSEFGPRALGARSILADPRRQDAKELLNKKIKRRESFRPFAPSILKEYVGEYFQQTGDVPFMEKVFVIRPEKRWIIPAVTHVDGTGRLQTVDQDISPAYYRLIETFRKKTGIPILLNTSFNENEPIVNSPAEAVNCFLRTDMDMLVMENIVLTKERK